MSCLLKGSSISPGMNNRFVLQRMTFRLTLMIFKMHLDFSLKSKILDIFKLFTQLSDTSFIIFVHSRKFPVFTVTPNVGHMGVCDS